MAKIYSEKDRKYMMMGLKIVGDFGATIAVPIILFVLVGQWLDDKYHRSPWYTVIAFILAAVLSGKMIYQKAKNYGQEYQKLDSVPKKSDENNKA